MFIENTKLAVQYTEENWSVENFQTLLGLLMNCKICSKNSVQRFKAKVLNKYEIQYFHCTHCGFMQTEEPYWLDEAYKSPINLTDTGLVQRNIYLSKKVAILLYFYFGAKGKYLDYAGGYGLFTRLMRDIGFDFYWIDQYTQNLMAKGFEYTGKNEIETITTFETFEHLVSPLEEIEKMVKISPNIIFTTMLLPNIMPKIDEWWYLGLEHGQHVSFYSELTLHLIAKKFGLNFSTNGKVHFFSQKKVNPIIYSILLKLDRIGLLKYISTKIEPRTVQDMNFLLSEMVDR